jgi:hypothetical protein
VAHLKGHLAWRFGKGKLNADIEYVLSGEAQKKLAEALPLLAQYSLGQLVKG